MRAPNIRLPRAWSADRRRRLTAWSPFSAVVAVVVVVVVVVLGSVDEGERGRLEEADVSSLVGGETGRITVDWTIIEDLIRLGSLERVRRTFCGINWCSLVHCQADMKVKTQMMKS